MYIITLYTLNYYEDKYLSVLLHTFDDDWPGGGRLCRMTKWYVKLIPNFIGLKALNKQKMT